jgi:hypothetical protein
VNTDDTDWRQEFTADWRGKARIEQNQQRQTLPLIHGKPGQVNTDNTDRAGIDAEKLRVADDRLAGNEHGGAEPTGPGSPRPMRHFAIGLPLVTAWILLTLAPAKGC